MYELNLTQIYSGTDAVFLHAVDGDRAGNFLDVNDVACRRLGYTRHELLKMSVHDIDIPEILPHIPAITKKLRAEKTATWEGAHLSKSGERIPVEINAHMFELDGKSVVLSIVRDVRERKKAEEELVWKTTFLEAQTNSSLDGILVVNDQGQRLLINQRFIEIFKVPLSILEKINDEALLDFVVGLTKSPDQFVERVKYLYAHPDEKGQDIVELKDGTILERYSSPVRDKNGKHYGRIWTFHDITKRKQGEEAVRDSENRFRALFEHMTEGVALHELVCDEQGRAVDYRILSVNPSYAKLTTLSATQVKDQLASKIYGMGAAPYLEQYARVAGTGEPFTFDTYFAPLNKYFSISVFSPKIGQFATVFTDITARKQAEDGLRASQQIIEGIINAIPVRVFWKDKDLVYLGCNAVFARDAGFADPKAIIGKDDYQMGWHAQADLYRADDREVIESGRPKMFIEESQTTPDGTIITLLTSKIPLRGPNGEINGVLGTYLDITERKQMENELLKAHKLDSLGILAGGLAHDFNNILTGIVGNISLARDGVDPKSESVELLNEAESAAFQARNLTQQLLTFAKGGAPVKKVTMMTDVIMEAAVFASRGSKCKCEFRIENDLSPVMADPGQVAQVINNMVINAVQAMPEGGEITVQAENVDVSGGVIPVKDGRYIRIMIKDTGAGIAPNYLAKIFDPYFTTKQTGSGLGLATCYSIVKKHDGHITVESEMGKGTSFSVYLPAHTGTEAVSVHVGEKEMKMGHGRILVMDDEPAICTFISKVLVRLGYRVETTADGGQAVARYRETLKTDQPFDAVILDLTVPGGKGGQEAIKELLQINPKIKALVSSGYANDPIMADFKNHGFSAVLAKPYNAEELSQVLHQLLS